MHAATPSSEDGARRDQVWGKERAVERVQTARRKLEREREWGARGQGTATGQAGGTRKRDVWTDDLRGKTG